MGDQRGNRDPVEDRARRLPGDRRPGAERGGRPHRRDQAAHLRGALPALGAPAVADPGARLQPRPRGLERAASTRKSASSACTGSPPSSSASRRSPRSWGRSCARRRPRTRRSSSARRSPTRRATCASSSASTARSACSSPTSSREMLDADLRAPQRELRPPLRRDAEAAHRPALGRTRGHRGPGRGGDDLPHGDRGDAGPHRPALHHGLQRTRRDAAGLRRGLPERRPRRAPPRRLRLGLPAREGARGRALQAGDPAHAGGGRCRSPTECSHRPGRRRTRTASCSATRSPTRASSPAPA